MTAAVHIDGATRLYAIVGDPVVQVRSAGVFTQRFADAGHNAVLVPAQVGLDDFETVIPGLMALGNLDGLLVTAPLKAAATAYATHLGRAAACIGAVNALRREPDGSWTGDIFDGAGFVRGFERKGHDLRARRVLMFGAGGAGSAIAFALADAGVRSVHVVSPDEGRGARLIDALRQAFPSFEAAAAGAMRDGYDMIVNASPVGMRAGDGLPGDIGPLAPGTLVGDVVVSDAPTAIVQRAIDRGCAWTNGRDMHGGQVDAIMAFFAPRLTAVAPSAKPPMRP
jgi:shikimate dehydrogenase